MSVLQGAETPPLQDFFAPQRISYIDVDGLDSGEDKQENLSWLLLGCTPS